MTIPRYDGFPVPVLCILTDGRIHASGEMLTLLADEFAVTEEEYSRLLPSGRSRVLNGCISWARTYLKKAGFIESPRHGTHRITRSGKEALASGTQIDNDYLERYELFRSFENLNGDSSTRTTVGGGLKRKSEAHSSEETPDEALDRVFSSINIRLTDDLLSEMPKLPPIAFERLVLDPMAKMEYRALDSASQMTPISEDRGIDGIIMKNKLGFDLTYTQTKHYTENKTVGRPDIRTFIGAITGRGGKGLFAATIRFAGKAITYAKRRYIIPIDGHKFAQLMIGYGFGVSTRKAYEIKAVDSDVFSKHVDEE